ncbi:unnamed protein product [Ostreobium quekettii]|uniref:Intraflagellar transport protein 20 n=1 Tax=Ostreobium quekettii TaxID=121088 RepID=A0A8S1IZD7_9CHLO|nr:unnamed protein product [Ostreobium quekettii]|eukprot:evm.model.scf_18.3 EVM.evm.TU.scf_18.3   scf_18:18535-19653(+)
MASEDAPAIFFDDEYRIRVLDLERLSASKSLQTHCENFVDRVDRLQELSSRYLAAVEQRAERIEAEKLAAIGLRNQAAAAEEEGRRRELELRGLLAERQEELERLQVKEQSLLKLRQEQELMVAKLSDSSVGTGG